VELALEELRVAPAFRRISHCLQVLQRYAPRTHRVPRCIHHRHAAVAQTPLDPIAAVYDVWKFGNFERSAH
jgi:hypothetical protein